MAGDRPAIGDLAAILDQHGDAGVAGGCDPVFFDEMPGEAFEGETFVAERHPRAPAIWREEYALVGAGEIEEVECHGLGLADLGNRSIICWHSGGCGGEATCAFGARGDAVGRSGLIVHAIIVADGGQGGGQDRAQWTFLATEDTEPKDNEPKEPEQCLNSRKSISKIT